MSASLVRSEMCIRDRSLRPGLLGRRALLRNARGVAILSRPRPSTCPRSGHCAQESREGLA
eukprot:11481857-Alexandrium_andersonii.AAC.1